MRPIDADALKESLLKERDKISLEYIERYSFGCPSPNKHGEAMRGGIRKALRCMEETPTLDYAPVVHGEWEERTRMLSWCDDDVDVYFVCSACKEESYGKTLFCPNCGAKMDGGESDG